MGSNAPVPPYLVFSSLIAVSSTKLIGRQNIQVRVILMPPHLVEVSAVRLQCTFSMGLES